MWKCQKKQFLKRPIESISPHDYQDDGGQSHHELQKAVWDVTETTSVTPVLWKPQQTIIPHID